MQGYRISFCIYAENEEEAHKAEQSFKDFVDSHAKEGRAVSAKKIIKAMTDWGANPFVKNYFAH